MSRPSFHPRCSEKEIRKFCRGFKGWDLARMFLTVREMLFSDNPRKVSQELAEFDKEHPGEHLKLKI